MKIKQLMAAFLSATVLATSVAPVFAVSGSVAGEEVSKTYTTEAKLSADLPEDQAWTAADTTFNDMVLAAASDGTAFGPYNGISGYGKFVAGGSAVKYTHTNGETYNFTKGWQAGSGGKTKRCLYFTPQQSCIVTVAYTAAAGRPVYIYQGKNLLATGEAGALNGIAATIQADIEDPSAGDVYVYGGSQNKQIYGIFADYYDPNVLVTRKVSGNLNYTTTKDTTNMKVVFTDQKDGTRYEVPYSATYSVDLRQNRTYDITVEGIEDVCATLDTNTLTVYKKDLEYNIDLVDIVDGEVTGEIVTHGLDMSGVTLTFTAKDDASYTKNATITALADGDIPTATNALSIVLTPNKEYTVTATGCDGYELSPLSQSYLMVAGDTSPFKNILFTKVAEPMAFKNTLTVGADKEYQTVTDAVKAVGNMTERPEGEDGRVNIVIDPGTYVEQVIVDKDYVTFTAADPANRPTISFYYGIAYLYYSAVGGYYSEDAYVQRTSVGTVDRWGCTVRVTAANFRAENIIFENSFNFRVTEEELVDGVQAAGPGWYKDTQNHPDRTVKDYDARSSAAVERAAAFAGDGVNYECYNCDFMSSQDTLYTNKNGYFKNCYIEGGTDYIFGGSAQVFDDCTLAWHGYSDTAKGGYITACSNSSSVGVDGGFNMNNAGYLFRNCTVANSKYAPDNKFAAGGWGRNWGGANCQVVFLNTKMDGVDVPGAWTKMGGELSGSILYVDGVTDKNGETVNTANTTFNPNGTIAETGYTVQDPTAYFGDWTPKYYDASAVVPTSAPVVPTEGPATEKPVTPSNISIKDVKVSGGNTVVTLDGTGSGVVIAAKFNGKVLADIKSAAINGTTVTVSGIEATNVYVWDSMENAIPLCAPYTVSGGTVSPDGTYTVSVASGIENGTVKIVKPAAAAPTAAPTEAPTAAPTSAPVATPPVAEGTSSYFVTKDTSGAAGTVYTEDENLTVTLVRDALVDVNLEKDPGDAIPVEINGVECCYYIGCAMNSAPSSYDTLSGTSKGSPIDISPKKDGKFVLYYRWLTDGRDTYMMVMNEDGSFTDQVEGEKELHSENILGPEEAMISVEYGTKTFDLEAGKTYIIYSTGATSEIFGYTFTPGTATAAVASDEVAVLAADAHEVDFTTMNVVPVYSAETGSGFTSVSGAILAEGKERKVDPTAITISAEGASITESTGSYLYKKSNSLDGDDYNHGGLIYRWDTGKAGAYRIEVEVADKTKLTVAPTGMNGGNITKTGTWDNAGLVERTTSATWTENVWSFDFATGEKFVEVEIEPTTLPTADAPQTVTVKSIKITPLEVNPAGDKPTIHILGDSTQKTYTFNEVISAWGQTLVNYFNPEKANVINYSMGGRSMKANYMEGRANEPLIKGKAGDFVFIHSAHNDETVSTNRFSRGAGISNDLATNNANQNRWLDMYVEMIKARGMTPVLVTAMPRTGNGVYSESAVKPNGFNPDSPGNMRAKAASDPQVALVELYAGAKAYFDKLDAKEVMFIYNNYEAGESPAENYANGGSGDGTHYREGASKQFNRIMLQSIYDQSVATEDTYTDKAIMAELVTLMKDEVVEGASTGNWSKAFPEMASDVSAVDIIPGAEKTSIDNYYYRNNIEKALQLGLLSKDKDNLFKPTDAVTVGEFARSVEKVFGLEANSLTSYTKTAAELGATTASLAADEEEVLVDTLSGVKAGDTVTVRVMPNSADASITVTTTPETTVTPVDGKAGYYTFTMPAANTTVSATIGGTAVEGPATVTITQAEGGEITVYNESAFNTSTVDVTANVTAGATIGETEHIKLTAPTDPANLVKKTNKDAVFADNKEISINAIEFRNSNPEKIVVVDAYADGKITVYCKAASNKPIELKDIAGEDTTQSGNVDGVGTLEFNVKAGKSYQLYTCGGTGQLFGVKYASTNYPQSTESLEVSVGDIVRVAALASKGYVNGSILVNGEEVSTGKEYTFAVTGPTTVTATFVAEPEFVEVTNIPSDAALTREAMGAIMYDAYQMANTANPNGNWHTYFGQNGGVPSPDDPNYDPNIKYEGSPYIPLTGWGALTDKAELSDDLFGKVKEVYNLGLIRSEQGLVRGASSSGTILEPKTVVTRAKAAKALVFLYILTQNPKGESQWVPEGSTVNVVDSIAVPTEGVAALPVK